VPTTVPRRRFGSGGELLRAGRRTRRPGRDPAFELGCTRPGRCGPTRSAVVIDGDQYPLAARQCGRERDLWLLEIGCDAEVVGAEVAVDRLVEEAAGAADAQRRASLVASDHDVIDAAGRDAGPVGLGDDEGWSRVKVCPGSFGWASSQASW